MRYINGRIYNTDIESNAKVSEHFNVHEFKCKAKTNNNIVFIDDELIQLLEDIRKHFAKPVHINSAYRTPEWNKQVSGTSNSYHMYGMAADIWVSGVATNVVARYASELLDDHGGVILYSNFVHIDVRKDKYRKGVI